MCPVSRVPGVRMGTGRRRSRMVRNLSPVAGAQRVISGTCRRLSRQNGWPHYVSGAIVREPNHAGTFGELGAFEFFDPLPIRAVAQITETPARGSLGT